jgi:hypothetical protein
MSGGESVGKSGVTRHLILWWKLWIGLWKSSLPFWPQNPDLPTTTSSSHKIRPCVLYRSLLHRSPVCVRTNTSRHHIRCASQQHKQHSPKARIHTSVRFPLSTFPLHFPASIQTLSLRSWIDMVVAIADVQRQPGTPSKPELPETKN